MEHGMPRLCGGIFLVLLLQARKQRTSARDKYAGGNDGLSDTDILKSLIRIFTPNYEEPYTNTFKKNTSDYKKCTMTSGTYLPFSDVQTISTFDFEVKNDYRTALSRMVLFVTEFLDVNKSTWLIAALLEILDKDNTISNSDTFFISENGNTLTKSELLHLDSFYIQPFLLGIWHYIITQRQDNLIGRETFASLHETPEKKGQSYKFNSDIGKQRLSSISTKILELEKLNSEQVNEDDFIDVEIIEPEQKSDSSAKSNDTEQKSVNQSINGKIVVIQQGNPVNQIAHVETLNFTINKGDKSND
jgi:hypothetical protein